MTTLTQASSEWMKRPADQRFSSLEDLSTAVRGCRDAAKVAHNVDLALCAVDVMDFDGDGTLEPVLTSPSGRTTRFCHYAFGQVARMAGAPASYLRELPAPLAAKNLTHGLQTLPALGDSDDETTRRGATLLVDTRHEDSEHNVVGQLRAVNSSRYTRIWNDDVVSRLIRLREQSPEWNPAPAAFDGSRGLYASDNDMFAFMVDNDRRIFESLPGGGLGRGFFVTNSEIGAAAFKITTFRYNYVCGNHMVWGAKDVAELSIRHVGNADDRAFAQLTGELRKYADGSEGEDVLKIQSAMKYSLGADKDAVLDAVFGLRIPGLSRRMIGAGYDQAVLREDRYGDPTSAWALASGITELSQLEPNASDRVALDRAAGKIMEVAF